MNAEFLIPISLFAAIFGILYLAITARTKERLALLEHDKDASVFLGARFNTQMSPTFWTLKVGMLLIGLGIGILIGTILEQYSGLDEPVAYFSMMFLFGGLSLIIYYFVERRIIEKQKQEL